MSLENDLRQALRRVPAPEGFAERVQIVRSEEHTSELQSRFDLVCRLLLEKKKINVRSYIALHRETRTEVSNALTKVPSDDASHYVLLSIGTHDILDPFS